MTNNTLRGRGGSELYIRDIALALRNRGHDVVAYSSIIGEVAEEIKGLGIPVVGSLEDLSEAPDVIHGQHHLDAAAAALRFPSTPVVYACHGWLPWQEAPITYPLASRYVAVSRLTRARLVTSGVPPEIISVIPNFVDLARFSSRRPKDRPIRRVLAYGNPWAPADAALTLLRQSCHARGYEFEAIGEGMGNSCSTPQDILPTFDVVFAVGRSALEAMACGCAVVVSHPSGINGPVTVDSFPVQRDANFGLALLAGRPVTADVIERIFDSLSLDEIASVTDQVRESMGLENATTLWEDQYRLAISSGAAPIEMAVSGLSKHLVRLKETTTGMEDDLRSVRAQVQHLESELAISGALAVRLRGEAVELEQRLSLLGAERDALLAEKGAAEERSATANRHLERMVDSLSWRLTKPLRTLRGIF